MNKWLLRFATILLIIGILAGCGTDSDEKASEDNSKSTQTEEQSEKEDNAAPDEESVTITISKDEGEEIIDEKEVPIEEDAILMDVLKENFDVEEDGGFITSIEGVAPKDDEEKAWMFSVNGEMANVGANDLELSPDDEVTFDLQAW